jgi:hypothetical protein
VELLTERAFHRREPRTSWDYTVGVERDGALFFLAAYTLYLPPKGIARFPDGGVPKVIFHRTALYRLERDSRAPEPLLTLSERALPGENLRNSLVQVEPERLLFVYQSSQGGRRDPDAWSAPAWHPGIGAPGRAEAGEKQRILEEGRLGAGGPGVIGSAEVKTRLAGLPPEEWGLPSPLEHAVKRPRGYARDLYLLRGDQSYREAILRAIRNGELPVRAQNVLSKIEERKEKLSGSKRLAYEIEVEETEAGLRELSR